MGKSRFLNVLKRFGVESKGVVAVVVALVLVVLIGMAAMAIDIGYWFSSKSECQNAADAAALAGASKLLTWNTTTMDVTGVDPTAAFAEAKTFSLSNQNAGTSLDILENDCLMGWWDFASRSLDPSRTFPMTATTTDPDDVTAFRVHVRRDATMNLPITSFFASIFGINQVNIDVVATAYLGWVSNVNEGDVELPIALIADAVADGSSGEYTPRCGQELTFRSENTETAEWTNFFDSPTNDVDIRRYVTGAKTAPALDATTGDQLNVTNGSLSQVTFNKLVDRFEAERVPNAPGGTWKTWMPVIYPSGSANTAQLVGFVQIEITDVLTAPDKLVKGVIDCNSILPYSRGGGGNFGVRAGIPVLVE
ncbi:pilus assembly protein TadG-related protein [Desulfoferula mesophila]|uniref:Flp pilus-assembly TadG-like N-terminal domain-containing protein n=1 Tax=Desulfoferula mesophila TaxID=3058419 RepID=A0AAU9EAS5_9BACT|nr:hypothetical protein FAK_07380 [Desulfoferula mesophilus]